METKRRVGKGPYRSILNPYIKEITQWRNERKSFAEIAKLLDEKYNLRVTGKTVWSFVKVRSKPPPPILNIHPAYLNMQEDTKEKKENSIPEKEHKEKPLKKKYSPEDFMTSPEEINDEFREKNLLIIEQKKKQFMKKVESGLRTPEQAKQGLIGIYEWLNIPYTEEDVNIFSDIKRKS